MKMWVVLSVLAIAAAMWSSGEAYACPEGYVACGENDQLCC